MPGYPQASWDAVAEVVASTTYKIDYWVWAMNVLSHGVGSHINVFSGHNPEEIADAIVDYSIFTERDGAVR